ncbi:MAG: DinB family protein [Melioribacteraceae bacterium]|nr:DinB family protein [Melioribacteraceae bacterium]
MLNFPQIEEYPDYYQPYIEKTRNKDVIKMLSENMNELSDALKNFSDKDALFAYDEGKWTIKQLLGHLIDAELILSNRALRFARLDKTDIPQYDHDDYVKTGEFNEIPLADLIDQLFYIRKANILLFKNLSNNALLYEGTSGGKTFTARSLIYIIAGHHQHHLEVLKEKYLPRIKKI